MYRLDKAKEKAIYTWVSGVLGSGVNEVQKISFSAVPTSGVWTITVLDENKLAKTTSELAYNANAAAVKAALEALSIITTCTVSGDYTAGFTITITSPSATPFYRFIITESLDCDVTVERTTEGSKGVLVIWNEPKIEGGKGERPRKPFATLDIVDPPVQEGEPGRVYKTTDVWTLQFRKIFTLSVNIYADNKHMEYLQKLTNSVYLVNFQEALQESNLELRNSESPKDLTNLLPNGYERRAQVSFNLGYVEEYDENVEEIRILNISASFTADNGSELKETINIDLDS